MKNIKSFAVVALTALSLTVAGCSTTQVTNATNEIAAYGKLVGTTVATVGNIAVSIECSAIPASASTTAGSIISIVAPTSSAAKQAATILSDNAQIAAQLCPLYKSITATVGTVTGNASSINITAPASLSITARAPKCGVKSAKPFVFVCH